LKTQVLLPLKVVVTGTKLQIFRSQSPRGDTVVKWHAYFRLLVVPLLTVLLLARVPLVEAAALGSPDHYFRVKHKHDDKDKKRATVPEGSGGAALVLAAAALGGGLLVSRRKRSTKAA
jgi:hypothetical protein